MQQRINFCLLEQTHATPKNTSPTTMTSSGDTQKSQILKLCTGREKIMMETVNDFEPRSSEADAN